MVTSELLSEPKALAMQAAIQAARMVTMTTKPETTGTPEAHWHLKTPAGTSGYEAWRDAALEPPALVVQVGKTQLRYQLRCIDDLYAMLKAYGDWMAGQRRRAEKCHAGNGRGLGTRNRQPGKGLVRHEKGSAWSLRDVCSAGARGVGSRGIGA
jgi:hypothetical protein